MKRMTKNRINNIFKYVKHDLITIDAIKDLKKGLKVFSHDGDWYYWMEKQNNAINVQVSHYDSNDNIGTVIYDINSINEGVLTAEIVNMIQKMNKLMRLSIDKN